MGCLVAFPLGVVQSVIGLHSVGCSGWYTRIVAVAYLSGFVVALSLVWVSLFVL
jgi:hypothetical protein